MTIQQKAVDAIRILSAESITRAGTGHPGICFGAAPVMYILFGEEMNYSSDCPKWENRDRFILSAGHGFSGSDFDLAFDYTMQYIRTH